MSDDSLQVKEKTLERFIPIGRQEIVADLLAAPHWEPESKSQFREFCQIFNALYHYKFHAHIEELKRCYTPFNPDLDIVTQRKYSSEEQNKLHNTLVDEMRQLLNNANYEELTIDDVNDAIAATSFYGVSVSVDLDDFEQLIVYYRGLDEQIEYKRNWKTLFLKKEAIEIPIYQRLFLLLKFKSEDNRVKELVKIHDEELKIEEAKKAASQSENNSASVQASAKKPSEEQNSAQAPLAKPHEDNMFMKWFKGASFEEKARKQVRKSRQNLPEDLSGDYVFLKLFKNIPRSDLEMLFPNQNVRLKMFDKIKLAVAGGGGTIFGIIKAATVITNLVAFIGAFVGLIGIIVRQIISIFTQRNKYMMVLSRSLYFHNLDNNFGVMNYLIDIAEEEEGKEAILAYFFLHTNRNKNYTQEQLDREIESYIKAKYGMAIDFEVDDGLRKLRKEGILIEQDDGILKVLDLPKACKCLDKQWDEFFAPE